MTGISRVGWAAAVTSSVIELAWAVLGRSKHFST
jgi:hypothetical protein